MQLGSQIIELKNVGPQKAQKLERLNIHTVRQLLEHFPRDYEDRSVVRKIDALLPGQPNTFLARLCGAPENFRVHNKIVTRARVKDETGEITILWYHQSYLKNTLKQDKYYLFTGKLNTKFNRREIISPEFEERKEGTPLSGGRIVPIYPTVNGISQKVLRTLILDTLQGTQNQLYEFLPKEIRKKFRLCDRNYAIWNIHFPENSESFFIARRRLVFEELFLLQISLMRLKNSLNDGKKGLAFTHIELVEVFLQSLPYGLTGAQKKVLQEIQKDMQNGRIMNRLVQGDVGSGKTVVAAAAAFLAIKNGYQAVMMAPTEVLASQHLESFQVFFQAFGIKTVLLTGSLKKKEREQALEDICSGEAQMIIGTHAVIQKTVTFYKLGLVITDEQHRFGVRQRATLSLKGNDPHVLVMTATPIPRTLALILYGDLDISIIDELPPGRQKIDTMAVPSSYHERIYQFIRNEIEKGRQVYIICPMIEESEKLEVQAALSYTAELKEGPFQKNQVACLHGKMKTEEKQEIMLAFSMRKIDILVSTTVIEVGINVPNATIMLIENAERFGLAQLHQLRGRVGRGTEKSYCILVTDSKTEVTKQRMQTMKASNDGFYISEMDLKLRGPGEFFGTRQHGLPEMKIANLYKDMDILKEAQTAAEKVLAKRIAVTEEESIVLEEEMKGIFQGIDQIGF